MPIETSTLDIIATVLFALAVLHTFTVKQFEHLALKYPEGSIGENFFHFLGEVEAVFGLWAGFLIVAIMGYTGFGGEESHGLLGGIVHGYHEAVVYMESLNYTEPAFVFVIMVMAGTRPVILFAERLITGVSNLLPFPKRMAFYISALIIGPLLGSFITEPAAMTVTALILLDGFYSKPMSTKFKYATLGLLFVNISIGGTLTHFAAPPVLMVAAKWEWGIAHMLGNFGYKATLAVLVCTLATAWFFRSELQGNEPVVHKSKGKLPPPWWITTLHLVFLALVVISAHHMVVFLGLFLFFLGFAAVTTEFQDRLKLRESLLVGFFLAGLVTLGNKQAWWLQPLLGHLNDLTLFYGATALTAITDNAALTYLGSLVELTPSAKYYLVAGAVAGGGLTVIANAPNPAGFGILKNSFGNEGISPLGLLAAAILPTLVALACFQFLPSFG